MLQICLCIGFYDVARWLFPTNNNLYYSHKGIFILFRTFTLLYWYPLLCCESTLFQILLEDDAIDEALNLLDQASSEGNKLDAMVFNTILRKACEKVYHMFFLGG